MSKQIVKSITINKNKQEINVKHYSNNVSPIYMDSFTMKYNNDEEYKDCIDYIFKNFLENEFVPSFANQSLFINTYYKILLEVQSKYKNYNILLTDDKIYDEFLDKLITLLQTNKQSKDKFYIETNIGYLYSYRTLGRTYRATSDKVKTFSENQKLYFDVFINQNTR